MKGITAREVFKQFSGKKRLLWGGEFWEDGRNNKAKGHESRQLELF